MLGSLMERHPPIAVRRIGASASNQQDTTGIRPPASSGVVKRSARMTIHTVGRRPTGEDGRTTTRTASSSGADQRIAEEQGPRLGLFRPLGNIDQTQPSVEGAGIRAGRKQLADAVGPPSTNCPEKLELTMHHRHDRRGLSLFAQ